MQEDAIATAIIRISVHNVEEVKVKKMGGKEGKDPGRYSINYATHCLGQS